MTIDEATNSASMSAGATPEPRSGPIAFDDAGYQPGVCNIGPAEIAQRRRSGHVAAAAAVALFAVLVVVDAPPAARLVVAVPAAGAASGYLQAHLRFCAGFGSRGVFNFGALGSTERVADTEARRVDRKRAIQIGAASLGVGVITGVAAAVLPV